MRFVEGQIEKLGEAGIQAGSVDLIISNCVVRLASSASPGWQQLGPTRGSRVSAACSGLPTDCPTLDSLSLNSSALCSTISPCSGNQTKAHAHALLSTPLPQVNLSPDKPAVLREAYRALAEGGEVYFSDVYCNRRLPEEVGACLRWAPAGPASRPPNPPYALCTGSMSIRCLLKCRGRRALAVRNTQPRHLPADPHPPCAAGRVPGRGDVRARLCPHLP